MSTPTMSAIKKVSYSIKRWSFFFITMVIIINSITYAIALVQSLKEVSLVSIALQSWIIFDIFNSEDFETQSWALVAFHSVSVTTSFRVPISLASQILLLFDKPTGGGGSGSKLGSLECVESGSTQCLLSGYKMLLQLPQN